MGFDQCFALRVHYSVDMPAHGKDLILIGQFAFIVGFQKIELNLASIHVTVDIHNECFDTAKTTKHTPLKNTDWFRHIITPLTV